MNYLLSTLVLTAVGLSVGPPLAAGVDLADYRWKNRLLLIFAPNETDKDFATFSHRLNAENFNVLDRDLVVFRIFETASSRVDNQPLSPEDAQALRLRFDIKLGQFTVILVGKDGGVKLIQKRQADLEEIFDLIDRMPMRRQEMREKS